MQDRTMTAMALALMLAACGGGGVQSTPTPTPPPTPTATPTPSLIDAAVFQTQEYANSNGATQAQAIVAWQNRATGSGITAAIVDSGLSNGSGEFTGRISAASANVAGGSGFADEDGHGTEIAGVLAAARNDSGIIGVAYEATILALRADTPGSCAGSGGCSYNDTSIAAGIDVAVAQRAKVINLSLGGSPANATLRAAIDHATAAGTIIVISAGNDGSAEADPFARIANDAIARGLVIVVGSSTEDGGAIADFSDRAGSTASKFILANGVRVRAPGTGTSSFLVTGTSISAPIVSGAVALLAQAFPNLTSAQIVSLLLSSANDIGAAGTDAVNGVGVLNIARAFSPQRGTSLAGSTVVISTGTNAELGSAFGDAAGQTGAAMAVIVDGYGRAYELDVARTMRGRPATRPLFDALSGGIGQASLRRGGLGAGFAFGAARKRVQLAPSTVGPNGTNVPMPLSGFVHGKVNRDMAVSFGIARSGTPLPEDNGGDALLVARASADDIGIRREQAMAVAMRQGVGAFGISLRAERGDVQRSGGRLLDRQARYSLIDAGIERRFGALRLGVGLGMIDEDRTLLGSRFAAGLAGGARSRYATARAGVDLARGWTIAAMTRRQWTRAQAGSLIDGGRFTGAAYALTLTGAGVLARGDRVAFRIAQPMRVETGRLALLLPADYDYATGIATRAIQTIDLAPRGREIDAELGWQMAWLDGWIATSAFLRRDPGNVADAPLDPGATLRLGLRW